MSTELDLEGIDNEEALQGYEALPPGQYHAIIEEVDDSREKVDALKVKFQVLAGNVAEQTGKGFWETFWAAQATHKDGGLFAKKRLGKLALSAGLIDGSALGRRAEVNWDDLIGRQVVIHVSSRKDGEKTYSQIDGLHLYRLGDPSQAHVPLDVEAAAQAGYKASAAAANGNGQNGGAAAGKAQSSTADKPAGGNGGGPVRQHSKPVDLRSLV